MSREVAADDLGNLRRLLLFRTVTATALLLPVLYYQVLVGSEGTLAPVYALIGGLYGVGLLHVLVQERLPRWRGQLTFQITIDAVLATALVHVIGGVRSPLVLLYLLIAFAAGVMTARQTALAIACLNGVLFGLVAHLELAERLVKNWPSVAVRLYWPICRSNWLKKWHQESVLLAVRQRR